MKMGSLHTFVPASIPRWIRNRKAIQELSIPAAEEFLHAPALADPGIFDEADRSIIRLVELLIQRAHAARASDMHIDPCRDALSVRSRIDGVLSDAYRLPLSIHPELISRIKILSGLRTDEHYGAQDGRFRLALGSGSSVDVRVSIVPTYYGENAVLRLLSESAQAFSLADLGFTLRARDTIMRALRKPYGMILATGPTGSGKTTSMYTLLKLLKGPGISIVTLEDPIEYSMDGVSQIQIHPKAGLTFATGLRSILRQDPNVVMVGEIRDKETAGLAVNTALTGHRLLSTLHANDAATTIARLLDMGVEPYLLASTVSLAIGSRLVRRICEGCKAEEPLTDAEIISLSGILPSDFLAERPVFFAGRGCALCGGTGFHGRAGIHEVLEIGPALRDAILERRPAAHLRSIAIADGMTDLIIDGFRKAARGITTVEEVLKIRYE